MAFCFLLGFESLILFFYFAKKKFNHLHCLLKSVNKYFYTLRFKRETEKERVQLHLDKLLLV